MNAATRWPSSIRVPILLVFVLSGAAGLIDEIVWSRQLVLVFGNTTQSVTAILVGFFGGMAIGAAVGGWVADRVRSPLRLYGLLEIVLAVVVVVTPLSFRLIHEVYRDAYPALEGSPQLLAAIRLGLSLLALGPATVLMGATLPALTRSLTRGDHLSEAFGRLYAANILGAIAGTLLAGLVLIELLGLGGALTVGAVLSLVAGVVALGLDHRIRPRDHVDHVASKPVPVPVQAVDLSRARIALLVAFVSGLTSLGYQVLWTRLLASGTGNTTYAFTAILAVFLVGLAIGALLFNVLRTRLGDPFRFLAAAQALTAALVLLGLVWFVGRPPILDPGRPLDAVATLFLTAIPVVLVTTIILGLTFPATSALLHPDPTRSGKSAGTLVAVNTLGSILGSFLVSFILIPMVGTPRSIALLAIANLGIAWVLSARMERGGGASSRLTRTVVGVVTVALVGSIATPNVLSQPIHTIIRVSGGTVLESTEDQIATVVAGRIGATPQLWVGGTSMTLLTVDAKLMTLLPLMARPDSENALVVAFGMGSSFRAGLIAGLQVDAVELAPSVPSMFGHFHPDAAAFLADPNGRIFIADGRNYLELTDRLYDVVITDPPPPIESSGASVISSVEYYQAGRRSLSDGGMMMQWLPFGSTTEGVREHVRSFASVFTHVRVLFGPGGYGLFMLGSDVPFDLPDHSVRAILDRPGVLEDVSSAFDSPAITVEDWVALIRQMAWLDDAQVRGFVGDGPTITDDRPLPEYFLIRRLLEGKPEAATESSLRASTR